MRRYESVPLRVGSNDTLLFLSIPKLISTIDPVRREDHGCSRHGVEPDAICPVDSAEALLLENVFDAIGKGP